MEISEAVQLLKPAFLNEYGKSLWADLGCGDGTFTLALSQLLGDDSTIYAVDQKIQTLRSPDKVRIEFIHANFENNTLSFSNLDGILMANSLHYVKNKTACIQKLKQHLQAKGRVIVVEYEMSKANAWVPYPLPYKKLHELCSATGFNHIEKIGERNSIYGPQKMYACLIGG